MFDRGMRAPASFLLALVLLGGAACGPSQPASQPASCECGAKRAPPPAPAREEPADIMR